MIHSESEAVAEEARVHILKVLRGRGGDAADVNVCWSARAALMQSLDPSKAGVVSWGVDAFEHFFTLRVKTGAQRGALCVDTLRRVKDVSPRVRNIRIMLDAGWCYVDIALACAATAASSVVAFVPYTANSGDNLRNPAYVLRTLPWAASGIEHADDRAQLATIIARVHNKQRAMPVLQFYIEHIAATQQSATTAETADASESGIAENNNTAAPPIAPPPGIATEGSGIGFALAFTCVPHVELDFLTHVMGASNAVVHAYAWHKPPAAVSVLPLLVFNVCAAATPLTSANEATLRAHTVRGASVLLRGGGGIKRTL